MMPPPSPEVRLTGRFIMAKHGEAGQLAPFYVVRERWGKLGPGPGDTVPFVMACKITDQPGRVKRWTKPIAIARSLVLVPLSAQDDAYMRGFLAANPIEGVV